MVELNKECKTLLLFFQVCQCNSERQTEEVMWWIEVKK